MQTFSNMLQEIPPYTNNSEFIKSWQLDVCNTYPSNP